MLQFSQHGVTKFLDHKLLTSIPQYISIDDSSKFFSVLVLYVHAFTVNDKKVMHAVVISVYHKISNILFSRPSCSHEGGQQVESSKVGWK